MRHQMITADQRIEAAVRGLSAYFELESQTRAFMKFRIRLEGESGPTCVKVHKSHPAAPFLEAMASAD